MEKNPLNEVDGNTLNIGIDDTDDKYHCPICDEYVREDEWNGKRDSCYSCWWKI